MAYTTDHKPYISSDKTIPELTTTSVITGILLATIFGSANAYLGLRVGMTVSASIPAAVVAMGVLRVILKKNSILESNIVQTIGSAGESVAAGAIFTLPTLFLWSSEGVIGKPSFWEIIVVALIGGLFGIFFMIPLRNALIVKEHGILPYPEGTACTKVLLAGEKGSKSSSVVFAGIGISALIKFITDGLKAIPGEISIKLKGYASELGTQIYPAVLGVGYICGPRIASFMFAGGILSWLVIIPLIVLFGSETILFPNTNATIGEVFAQNGASGIWSSYIRYIGAGALAAGGIISLLKILPLIIQTLKGSFASLNIKNDGETRRTSLSIGTKTTIISIVVLTLFLWLTPVIPISFLGAVIVVVFGFFFATVSSRMVGLVGSSNNPVSGMAIATLLIATVILKLTGSNGISGMVSSIAIGSVICIISAIAGDTSQDLKTGYLLGATPKKQQIGEIIGVSISAVTVSGTLYLLDSAWGFGSEELAAPQATLMKMLVEGVMNAELPWNMIFIGVFITIVAEVIGIPALPFAIGTYLPIHISTCIMTGGLIRLAFEKIKFFKYRKEAINNNGILFSSGMIAGEGIIGIILAVLAVTGGSDIIDMSDNLYLPDWILILLSLIMFLTLIITFIAFSLKKTEIAEISSNE